MDKTQKQDKIDIIAALRSLRRKLGDEDELLATIYTVAIHTIEGQRMQLQEMIEESSAILEQNALLVQEIADLRDTLEHRAASCKERP